LYRSEFCDVTYLTKKVTGVLYTSNTCFIVKTETGVDEFKSEKIDNYINTSKSIQQKNEWKTVGAGARFMGTYVPEYRDDIVKKETCINGVTASGDQVIYSARTGEVSGLYRKLLKRNMAEGIITSSRETRIYRISAWGSNCAASFGRGFERHIAIVDINTGHYRELTEGEVQEDYPSYSRDGSRIFYSSAGLALSPSETPIGIGAFGIFCYHIESNELCELLTSDSFDYIAPKEDNDGNLLFIKRPYRNPFRNDNILKDIVLFPVRIIRAIGGLLNYFSIAFGGESLRSGQPARDVKSKQRSEKDIFFEKNVINAQQVLRQNQRRGEKFPGIIPHSWELIRMDESGNQCCLKKGVMDYLICKSGDIVYSNGNAVIRLLSDGSEQLIEKRRMANNITEIV